MSGHDPAQVVEVLLDRHGRTFASEAGIRLGRGTPAPLFQLLCLALLVSARIGHETAIGAARALRDAGWTTPDKMAGSTWEQRTRVLDEAGYARYDESTARYLGETATTLVDRWDGDLRRLRAEADGDPLRASELLQEFTGVGVVGADVFLREVQLVWDDLLPFADERARKRAGELDLPTDPAALRGLVGDDETFVRLVAALVRCGLEHDQDEVLASAEA